MAAGSRSSNWLRAMLAVVVTAGSVDLAQAQVSRVSDTRHNLSASNTAVENRASTETEICVFCHTPHGSAAAPAPLWNRALDSGAAYVPYTSTSLDAEYIGGVLGAPGASSKLCLSCHDGTLAIGQVSNAPGSGPGPAPPLDNIAMTAGTGSPIGAGAFGATSGYTRRLGTDLRNDHPISVTYNATLATRDGELRSPPYMSGATLIVDNRTPSSKRPKLPLDAANQVQCSTCHEPHYTEPKFLRGKRLQASPPLGGDYRDQIDQICLACHDKLGLSWANSAHAKGTLAAGGTEPGDVVYTAAAATLREFPAGTEVWQAGCLNCHDTHTVQGAKRLLREGTDGLGNPRAGGNPAVENACYACHQPVATSAVAGTNPMNATQGVPDIQTEFGRTIRMPIASTNQAAGAERHDIGFNAVDTYKTATVDCTAPDNKCGADFLEPRARLGADNHTNRHVECTDCHNPHRVIKNSRFNGLGVLQRTHVPADGVTGNEGNVASGALRGAWGVEPTWTVTVAGAGATVTGSIWPEAPTTYVVKRGDPPANASIARSSAWLTREYQLCFKCHSDYGAGALMPPLNNSTNATAGGTNTFNTNNTRWTNVAAEFAARATDPPSTLGDQGEIVAVNPQTAPANNSNNISNICQPGGVDCVPQGSYPRDLGANTIGNVNHRSWHPVVWPTGRNGAERGNTGFANIRAPFNTPSKIGLQTMHCSDCHGQSTSWTATESGPDLTQVQGPHGSTDNFLLKGGWSIGVRINAFGGSLCENCHVISGATNSGFNGNHLPNTNMNAVACMRCHIAVPHGWKNKAFLVNKHCVGTEAGEAGNCVNRVGWQNDYNNGPYYNAARNAFRQWRPSRDGAYTNETETCASNTADFKDPGGREMKDCVNG